jgi:hypothetical protein
MDEIGVELACPETSFGGHVLTRSVHAAFAAFRDTTSLKWQI